MNRLISDAMAVWMAVLVTAPGVVGAVLSDSAGLGFVFGALLGMAASWPVVLWVGALCAETTLAFGKRDLAGFLAAWVLWGIAGAILYALT